MRPLIKYGIPAAAGLAVGGMLAQDQQPGVAALGGVGAALGGAAGLLGARKLAGKYAPLVIQSAQRLGTEGQEAILHHATKVREGGLRQQALLDLAEVAGGATSVNPNNMARAAGRTFAAGLVPASAGLAALGGQAAGMIPGAIGVPGFAPQQQSIDPESYGSSNSPGARYKQTTGSAGITGYYQ